MSCSCHETKRTCTGIALIFSAIIAIVVAFFQITASITLTPVALIVAFGIAVVYLALLLATIAPAKNSNPCHCVCSTLSILLASILGVILFAIILLAFSFAATSIIGAIIVGLLAFFFSLMLTTTACLVKCIANCNN